MNLMENIHRIHQMMGVITENKGKIFGDMIGKMGLYNTIKILGGYDDSMDEYITEEDKVKYIKDKVVELAGKIGRDTFNLEQIFESPIHYGDEDGKRSQIELLSNKYAHIKIYKILDNNFGYLRSDYVKYEDLPKHILDKIFKILSNN